MDAALKLRFEQIFASHHERLANTKLSVGGMPFTLENIVCFVLFGGRELDIEDIYGDVSERYSVDTFMADAKEAGIETNEALYKAISDMVAQKFLHLQPDGHFYSYQATRETARLLNRIYPKMKGINMLAYLGQTIQEVESGRIDAKTALSRFDQTLHNQGVPLPRPKIPTIAQAPKPSSAVLKKSDDKKSSGSKIIRDYVLTPAGVTAKIEKAPAETIAEFSPPESSPSRIDELSQGHIPNLPPFMPEPEKEPEPKPVPPPAAAISEPEPEKKEPVVVNDDEIAAKIAAFEKELALVCPICKTGVLKEETTAAGKPFYSCTSSTCNFISWGRPHQIPCPRCKNSFMVEFTDSSGQVFLKCPRATCQHRQPLTRATATPVATTTPPAAKKVVRKRLVRRKV